MAEHSRQERGNENPFVEAGTGGGDFEPEREEKINGLPNRGFSENLGQVGRGDLRYYSTSDHMAVGFSESKVVFSLWERTDGPTDALTSAAFAADRSAAWVPRGPSRTVVFEVLFEGARSVTPTGVGELQHRSHFFLGDDPEAWRTDVRNFRQIHYTGLYDGIDLLYRQTTNGLKYEFLVHPGANPSRISVRYQGVSSLAITAAGELAVMTSVGELRDSVPVAYQDQQIVACPFSLRGPESFGFDCARWDPTQPLVIDPLVYSTFLGAGGLSPEDYGRGVAVDANGSAVVVGYTYTLNFPTTPGSYDRWDNFGVDVFVTAVDPSGSALRFSTFLGGNFDIFPHDFGEAVTLDSGGNVYIAGWTQAIDFPTTPGAFDTTDNPGNDAFVAKLNPSGSALLYSSYLGGGGDDHALGVAVDSLGRLHVTGDTVSTDFPTTPGVLARTLTGSADAFVTELDPTGSTLVYSTYLDGGGIGRADYAVSIALDAGGLAHVAGRTYSGAGLPSSFLSKLDAVGSALVYSNPMSGIVVAVAVDPSGNAYVTGSRDNGVFTDAFVTKVVTNGSATVYDTLLGGSGTEFGGSIAVDPAGRAYVTGTTNSTDFPVSLGAYDTVVDGYDVFVAALDASGDAVLFGTYLGGNTSDTARGLALGPGGDAYVTGETLSADFPSTPGAFDDTFNGGSDAFVVRLIAEDPLLVVAGVDKAPAMVRRGETDVLMEALNVTGLYGSLGLTELRVDLTGSGLDSDIAAVNLYDDTNDNGTFESGIDWLLDSGAFVGRTRLLFPSLYVAEGTTERMLLTYDVAGSATAGATVGARIEDERSLGVIGGRVDPFGPLQTADSRINAPPTAGGPGVNGAWAVPIRVLPPVTALNWTYSDPDGEAQVSYEVRVGSAPGGSDLWNPGASAGSSASVSYSGPPLAPCTSYSLGIRVHDGNYWGNWAEAEFRVDGPPSAPSPPTSPINDSTVAPNALQTARWVAATDCDGDTLSYGYQISENTTMIASGTSTSLTSLPFSTIAPSHYHVNVTASDGLIASQGLYWFFHTAGVPVNALLVGGTDAAPPVVVRGQPDAAMLALSLTAAPADIEVTSLRVRRTGTSMDSDVAAVTAYEDVDGSLTVTPGDRWLGQTTLVSGIADVAMTLIVPGGANVSLLIAYAISSAATPSVTVGARLEDETSVSLSTSDVVSPFGPIVSADALVNAPPSVIDPSVNAETAPVPLRVVAPVTELGWTYADGDGHSQERYRARVGSTPGGGDVWDPGETLGSAGTLAYGGPPLTECGRFSFGIGVTDGYEWAWAEVAFQVNGPPTPPTAPTTPPNGSGLPAMIGMTAAWTGAADCDLDPILYEYRVWENGTILANGSTSDTTTGPFVTKPLSYYEVDVVASDGVGQSTPLHWSFNTTAVADVPLTFTDVVVSPTTGDLDTQFDFRVRIVDDTAPLAGYPLLVVRRGGAEFLNATMTEVDPLDTELEDGKWYRYTNRLPEIRADYDFYAVGRGPVGTEVGSALVDDPDVLNRGPVLAWTTEAGYSTGGLQPESGDTGTNFSFRVQYSDPDDHAPSAVLLHVSKGPSELPGSPFTMTFARWMGASDDYAAGAIFTHTLVLRAGKDYAYNFSAHDGLAWVLYPSAPIDAPDVGERPGKVSGRVASASEPFPGAIVVLLHANGTVAAQNTTDNDGAFLFNTVPPGTYTIQVRDPEHLEYVGGLWVLTDGQSLDLGMISLDPLPVVPSPPPVQDWKFPILLLAVLASLIVLLLAWRWRKRDDSSSPSRASTPPDTASAPQAGSGDHPVNLESQGGGGQL